MVSFSTVSGGGVSVLTGGNFWEGAATAFYVSLLNHAAHKITENGGNQDQVRRIGPKEGEKVMTSKSTWWERLWYTIEPRIYTPQNSSLRYQVDADGKVLGLAPIGGLGAMGLVGGVGGYQQITSLVKNDANILKLARETFKGNASLRAEANGLLKSVSLGNMNPGKGSKFLFKNVHEFRGANVRIYFRNNNGIEILGYSNKGNQQTVINQLKRIYGT